MMIAWIFMLNISFCADRINHDSIYQIDYRERVSAGLKIPALGVWEIKKSFETRYRPKKNLNPNNDPRNIPVTRAIKP
jgi:hypothetical protein